MSWLLWAVLTAITTGASLWHYRRRETPGRGRTLLALLRAGSFALLLLLLMDPELPATRPAGARGSQVLLDASLSMQLPAGSGTRWQRAVEIARARAGQRPVLLFGDQTRAVDAAALPDSAPGDARSRLLPALQAAAEAGVRRVLVITDGGLEDADAIARWAPRLGLRIETEIVGGDAAPNLALSEASAPVWAEGGSPVRVEFGVTGQTASDSVVVIALRDGRPVGRTTVAAPAAGRVATGGMELRLEQPPGGGWVPLQLAIENRDAIPDDDRRELLVQLSAEPAGIALVSLRPDWEPRFLAPVFEQALGLPLRAFIRSATGQFVRLAGGLEAGAPASDEDVRRAVERAEIVILHGAGVDAPAWAADVIGRARRILIFPAGDAGSLPLPVQIGAELPGDYFPVAAAPPSPVAPLLTDLEVGGVAPLSSLRAAESSASNWAPLLATRGRQGAAAPLIVAGEANGRRWAVALGSGYWQWSFRGGAERQLYVRLWSAMAGWLARERGLAALAPVRPARLTVPRGAAIPWLAPGILADSFAVTITAADGAAMLDTVIAPTARDSAFTTAPAPGTYRFRARAFAGDSVTAGEGVFAVESYSPEYGRPLADLASLTALATPVRDEDPGARRGTPLHATPYPFILLVLLLIAEWTLRRRWGLR